MAVLPILKHPDPRLRKIACKVNPRTTDISSILSNMLDTMYHAKGIGLAATQVDIHKRIIIIDLSKEQDIPLFLINPKIEILDSTLEDYEEGCLSIPNFRGSISRPNRIKVSALDKNLQAQSFEASNLLAICIQHEIDHLNGTLFIDHIPSDKESNKIEK